MRMGGWFLAGEYRQITKAAGVPPLMAARNRLLQTQTPQRKYPKGRWGKTLGNTEDPRRADNRREQFNAERYRERQVANHGALDGALMH